MDDTLDAGSLARRAAATPDQAPQQQAEKDRVIGKIVSVSGAMGVAVVSTKAAAGQGGDHPGDHPGEQDGGSLIGQIGSIVKMQVTGAWIFASVRGVRAGRRGEEAGVVYVDLDFIGQGELDEQSGTLGALTRGISKYPVVGSPLMTTTARDLEHLFARQEMDNIRVGTVFPTDHVPATLTVDTLLSKHFAVLGSTGTGKSSTLALLVHRVVAHLPAGHILILDPHNEYAEAFRDDGVHFDTANLSLPYWLMNLEEHIEVFVGQRTVEREVEVDILKRCLLAARKKGLSRGELGKVTVDTPVPYKLTDLIHELEVQAGKLEKPETLLPFLRLKNKIEELKNDDRYSFMFSGLLISDSLHEIVSRLFRFPAQGRPVSTLDLSGVPSDIVDVVVSVLARLMFDFAVWSRREATARPLLLVCEEAHRYVPEARQDQHGAARKSLERIAKEGRKYGVSLGLVSQRPSDLSESVLSQCGTILSMRMNNDRDRQFVERAMPEGSRGFLESLPSLRNRECIISGEGVTAPVRVRLDFLEEGLRPSSDDPEFSGTWRAELTDPSFVSKVIHRWRSQLR